MLLANRLRAVAGGAFTPKRIFEDGRPGVWFIPEPQYLYQDENGLTPISADNDPVGLMLNARNALDRGVVNQLLWSQAFDNAYWGAGNYTITPEAIAAPDGSITADLLTPTSGSSGKTIDAMTYLPASHTKSIYAKYNGVQFLQINWGSAFNGTAYANFDILNGTVTQSVGCTPAITDEGGGWFRLSVAVTGTATTSPHGYTPLGSGTAGRGAEMTGNGTIGLYLWGAQVENGALTAYQKTESGVGGNGPHAKQATSSLRPKYRTDGVLHWLEFDGVDDGLMVGFRSSGSQDRFIGVAYQPLITSGIHKVAGWSSGASASTWYLLMFRDSPVGDPYFAGYANDLSSGLAVNLDKKVVRIQNAGTAYDLTLDSANVGTATKSISVVNTDFNIGGENGGIDSGKFKFFGLVAANGILEYPSQLDKYLANRAGTSL